MSHWKPPEASPFPDHVKILQTLEQSQVAWNLEFQALYSKAPSVWSPAATKSELVRTVQLRKLAMRFADHATQLGMIILKELSLPNSQKVIRPVTGTVGGIAGAAAIKVAEHELKGTMAYLDCEIEGLHFPLMALIRYRGHALLAQSVLPIGVDTIRYGTCDHAKNLHTDLPELNAKMEQAAKILNIKGHVVWTRNKEKHAFLHAPAPTLILLADVEGHLGADGRFYIIDTARLFPPAAPRLRVGITPLNRNDNVQLYQLLRPELVKLNKVPLSSDAYSKFGNDKEQHIHDAEVLRATVWLEEERIPEFARYLEKRSTEVKSLSDIRNPRDEFELEPSGEEPDMSLASVDRIMSGDSSAPSEEVVHEELSHIVAEMHLHGINVRYLLQVYYHVNDKNVRVLVLTEAISRVLKTEIGEKWRKIDSTDQQAFAQTLVAYMNLVFSRTEETEKYWNGCLKKALLQQFPAPLDIFSRVMPASGISNNAGSCSSEDESQKPPTPGYMFGGGEETTHEFFLRVAIGLHMPNPEKFSKQARGVVGTLCSTVTLLRELVESQYWAKKIFSPNASDNDMIKTHVERLLPRPNKRTSGSRRRSSPPTTTSIEPFKLQLQLRPVDSIKQKGPTSMDRLLGNSFRRKSAGTEARSRSDSSQALQSQSGELTVKGLKEARERYAFMLKKEANLDLAFQRTMFLLGVRYQFGGVHSDEVSSSDTSPSPYGPASISNESKDSRPKGDMISQFFLNGGQLTIANIVDILPVVKHIHKISLEEGTALSRFALTHSGAKARRLFELANKRFEECIQIKPDDHYALYNWAFALRKQALLSSGKRAKELWALVSEKYSQALVLHPRDWQALSQWGAALVMQAQQFPDEQEKHIAQAFEHLTKAADLAPPTHFKTSFNTGGVCLIYVRIFEATLEPKQQLSILRKAISHFETALDAAPSCIPVMQNLAVALSKHAKLINDKEERERTFERSTTYFQRAHAKDPKNKYLLFDWGTALTENVRFQLAVEPSKANKNIRAAAEKFRMALSLSSTLFMDGLFGFGALITLSHQSIPYDNSGRRAKYTSRFALEYLEYTKAHFFRKKTLPPEVIAVVSLYLTHSDTKLNKLASQVMADYNLQQNSPNRAPLRRSRTYGGREHQGGPINHMSVASGLPPARSQIETEPSQPLSSPDSISSGSPRIWSDISGSSFWEKFRETKATDRLHSPPAPLPQTPRRKEFWWARQRSLSAMDDRSSFPIPSQPPLQPTLPLESVTGAKAGGMGALVKRFSGVLKPKNTKISPTERMRQNRPLPLTTTNTLLFFTQDASTPVYPPESLEADQEFSQTIIFNKKLCAFRSSKKQLAKRALFAFAFNHPCVEKTVQIFQSNTCYYTLSTQVEGRPFLICIHELSDTQDSSSFGKKSSPPSPAPVRTISKKSDGNFFVKPKLQKGESKKLEEKEKKPNKKDSVKSLGDSRKSDDERPAKPDKKTKTSSRGSPMPPAEPVQSKKKPRPKSDPRVNKPRPNSDPRNDPRTFSDGQVASPPTSEALPEEPKSLKTKRAPKKEFPSPNSIKRDVGATGRILRNGSHDDVRVTKTDWQNQAMWRSKSEFTIGSIRETENPTLLFDYVPRPLIEREHDTTPVIPHTKRSQPIHVIKTIKEAEASDGDRSWRSISLPARLNELTPEGTPVNSCSSSPARSPKDPRMETEALKFYIAEMALVIDFFDEIGYIYQDFNPTSILLTTNGHLCVRTCWELSRDLVYSKTPREYLSPEIISSLTARKRASESGVEPPQVLYHWLADDKRFAWWALGVFFYQAFIGTHPFLYGKELRFRALRFPPNTDTHLKYFFELLLDRKVENRLCSLAKIKTHSFFRDFNWETISNAFSESNLSMLPAPLLPIF